MANCPVCSDQILKHQKLNQSLAGHGCTSCGGVLINLVSYRLWCDRRTDVTEPADFSTADIRSDDSGGPLNCPKCSAIMSKYRVSSEANNRVDYCAHCDEVWLDGGELELLHRLALDADIAKIITEPWQQQVREQLSEKMQRERLQKTFGNDYAKLMEVMTWIDEHPLRDKIIARILD